MDLFLSSCEGRETPNLLGPLERANLNGSVIEVGMKLTTLPSSAKFKNGGTILSTTITLNGLVLN
jgi:hypothetical protein